MPLDVKICGLNTPGAMNAAIAGRARYVGLVFFPPSPRHVAPDHAAALARLVPATIRKVGLVVDADDDTIDRIVATVPLDMLQLHGDEPPARVNAIKSRTGLLVIKAIKVSSAADLAMADRYAGSADMLLFDAKPPKEMAGALPGGNAISFDWTLLTGHDWESWMLSGGLDADNLAKAVRISGARTVDVSSGVESQPGRKDAAKIKAFLDAAAAL